ncbi:hypothetical protein [Nocardioides plantarum]|uniref:Phospholipase D-like protein n=1 Tax=Nocardioides plantarum TaxID=29299 RepID=A0ABV5K7P2_9ACTN|nr:hypothetical protein [Nocardioides plantarum]
MPEQDHELPPLAPSPLEVGITVVSIVHLVLVAVVVVQLLRGKMRLPHGVWGFIVLVFVPVIGPLLVLTWQGRVERYQARMQRAVAAR